MESHPIDVQGTKVSMRMFFMVVLQNVQLVEA